MTADRTSPATLDPEALSMAAIRDGLLHGRPVTVLGLARSGIALARFLADAGASVTVYDGRDEGQLRSGIEALAGRPIRLLLGPGVEPREAWAGSVLVTTSPSISPDYPTTEPRLRAALRELVTRRAGGDLAAPALLSEADLFLRLCPAPTVGVTGTKGKTTTAALAYALLAADPRHPAVLGGNIGIPLVERLPELTPDHRVVIELSELQLPTLSRGTTVAVYTNVTADHLDRHGSLAAYRRVKRRLAELVDPAGAVVLNADDPVVASYGEATPGRIVWYGHGPPRPGGLGAVEGRIVAAGLRTLDGRTTNEDLVLEAADLAIPGQHNVSNAMAAAAAALLFGVPVEALRRAAAAFRGVEHRLEVVAIVDGVRFVNDSQGTQPDAVIAALRAFEPPIVLIAGGRDKSVDLADLALVAAERAVAAVLIGESAATVAERFGAAGLRRIERAASLEAAVATADAIAREAARGAPAGRPGATVLLSPAAASFDMFVDYEARGRAFKAAVADLAERRSREGAR
jgi:UDP-N-acetylmuramoylalanine--D-glutamate ligase